MLETYKQSLLSTLIIITPCVLGMIVIYLSVGHLQYQNWQWVPLRDVLGLIGLWVCLMVVCPILSVLEVWD